MPFGKLRTWGIALIAGLVLATGGFARGTPDRRAGPQRVPLGAVAGCDPPHGRSTVRTDGDLHGRSQRRGGDGAGHQPKLRRGPLECPVGGLRRRTRECFGQRSPVLRRPGRFQPRFRPPHRRLYRRKHPGGRCRGGVVDRPRRAAGGGGREGTSPQPVRSRLCRLGAGTARGRNGPRRLADGAGRGNADLR